MKPTLKIISLMSMCISIFMVSCSMQRVASNSDDDVYNSNAKAIVMEPRRYVDQRADSGDYQDDYYGSSDPYYDMNYASRLNRFYYGSPWRGYFDPFYDPFYYNYSPFSYYNPYFGYSPSFGFGLGFGFGFGGSNWGIYGGSPFHGWGYSPFGFGYSPYGYYGGIGYAYGSPWGWNANNHWRATSGLHTGRTVNVPNYRGYADNGRGYYDSYTGRRIGITDARGNRLNMSPRSNTYQRNDPNQNIRRSYGDRYSQPRSEAPRMSPNSSRSYGDRYSQPRSEAPRMAPTRSEAPRYSPPPSSGGGGRYSGGGGGGGGHSGGGASRGRR